MMEASGPDCERGQCLLCRLALLPGWAPYLVAVGVVGLAAAMRIWPLASLGSTLTWITFYPAVLVAATVGGFTVGMIATGLTCVITIFGWQLLVNAPFIKTTGDWVGVAVFILSGALISALAEAMRRGHARARTATAQAEAANQQLARQHAGLVEAHQQLERMSRLDTLTGLVNRAETLARLEAALNDSRRPGRELGVLFCDVDKFKLINDGWGHEAGDAVLWGLAERISHCLRHGDTVGRIGGDEFLVLLPGLHSPDEVTQIAEKILARMVEPIWHDGTALTVQLSIGATLAVPGESVAETTSRADAAMYQAKHRGGNTVMFTR